MHNTLKPYGNYRKKSLVNHTGIVWNHEVGCPFPDNRPEHCQHCETSHATATGISIRLLYDGLVATIEADNARGSFIWALVALVKRQGRTVSAGVVVDE